MFKRFDDEGRVAVDVATNCQDGDLAVRKAECGLEDGPGEHGGDGVVGWMGQWEEGEMEGGEERGEGGKRCERRGEGNGSEVFILLDVYVFDRQLVKMRRKTPEVRGN